MFFNKLKLISQFFLIIALFSICLQSQDLPLIIGHRGACGHCPEHTLASYELAIEMGADYVEPDLVSTKDGVLICRHENEIGETTDVSEKFPERKTKKTIDGVEISGWFAEDFTLSEIKKLKAKERLSFRNKKDDGKYEIPTLQEMICLVKSKSKEKNREIGIYPETKHPSYHQSVGLSLEEPLVEILKQNGYIDEKSPVFIQSFEIDNLKKLKKMTKIRLIQLMDGADDKPGCAIYKGEKTTYRDMMTADGLKDIAQYAYGIGPWKELIMPRKLGFLSEPNSLISDAHNAGLKVHIYTLRNEIQFLAFDYKGDPCEEYYKWFKMGIDGIFTDFPDTGIKARKIFYKK